MNASRRLCTVLALALAAPGALAAAPAQAPDSASRLVAAPGLVEPVGEEREVGSEVIGVIREMRVDENDHVAAGQIIAVIDNQEQQAQLASTQATLALRRAELAKLMNGARPEERREAAANLKEADANLVLARQDYQRELPLARSGVASRQALDLATSTLGAAAARRDALAEQLALIEAPPRAEDVAADQAQVALAQADVAEAASLLEKTYVRSPITGTVLRRYLVAGEAVGNQPPTPIAVIGDLSRLRVRAEVDETDVGRVAAGEPVTVTADAYPGQHFQGTVERVDLRMGSKTVLTGRPAEQVDTKVLQVLIDLTPGTALPVGLRVDAYFGASTASAR